MCVSPYQHFKLLRDYTIVLTKCALHFAFESVSTRASCRDKSQRNGIPPHFSYYSYCHKNKSRFAWVYVVWQSFLIVNTATKNNNNNNKWSPKSYVLLFIFFSYKNLYIPDDSSHYTRLIIKCMTLEFVSVIIILVFKMFGIKKKTLIS